MRPSFSDSMSSANHDAIPLANAMVPRVVMTGLTPTLVIITPLKEPNMAPMPRQTSTMAQAGKPM